MDSSVAALLLKESGYSVSGATMHLTAGFDSGKRRCCGPEAIADAKKISSKLKIKHYLFDFSQELEKKVISKFIKEYSRGRTPNPCVDCNKFIKFGFLLEKAKKLGFDFLATGHYAGLERKNKSFFLTKPKDRVKDQTYFLCQVKKNKLKSALFPLADYTKDQVRKIAKEKGLAVFNKPQSQDLCFVLGKKYSSLAKQEKKEVRNGLIVNVSGQILGRHQGVSSYTVGQRKGLGISSEKPLYVLALDAKKNRVIVGEKKKLKKEGLIAGEINLFVESLPLKAKAKIRYAHRESACKIRAFGKKIKVVFEKKQEAVTPGQAIAFYHKNRLLGGGTIKEALDEIN